MKQSTKLVAISMWLTCAAVLLPMSAQAGLEDITLATGYYNEPVSNTGGALVTLRLPFGTMPGTRLLLPEMVVDRLYYSVGGTLNAQGPGPQPPAGLLLVGLGVKLHEYLGVSAGLSRHEANGLVANTTYWSVDINTQVLGELINPGLLRKVTGGP